MIFFLVFILIWVVITAAVIAVHFWFLSLPLVCVGGGLAIRRHQHRKQLARHQPGPVDPWLNEVVVAVSELDFDEHERNVTDHYFGVLAEGYVELRKQRVIVDVVLFANQIQTRNAEMAMRTEPTVRSELSREMAALHNGGRVLIVARTKMGAIDEYDFGEIVRLVGEIPLPPPIVVGRAVAYRTAHQRDGVRDRLADGDGDASPSGPPSGAGRSSPGCDRPARAAGTRCVRPGH